ncbi:hypothetical protein [Brevibacterium sp. FME37]|uniref:hypothetical protein n=1 Tax=Brevibacterium sp. FME37 TaxID=2742607 RepID=UPI0018681D12|nr:hypothetical protein [Brevibacterium sp. FME37]
MSIPDLQLRDEIAGGSLRPDRGSLLWAAFDYRNKNIKKQSDGLDRSQYSETGEGTHDSVK